MLDYAENIALLELLGTERASEQNQGGVMRVGGGA